MQAVPVSVSVSLPGIDSSVYDFRALSAGNYLPGDEQSFSGSGAEISGAGAAANPENIGTVEPEAEPEPEPELGGYMVGPSNHVRQRTQFTRRDDVLLLQVVLANSQLLAHDFKSKSRRVFWHRICSELAAGFGVLKNKRQCRDRFKLLFHRAISQNQFEQRNAGAANALTNSSPDTELDKLASKCLFQHFLLHRNQGNRSGAGRSPPANRPTHSSILRGICDLHAALAGRALRKVDPCCDSGLPTCFSHSNPNSGADPSSCRSPCLVLGIPYHHGKHHVHAEPNRPFDCPNRNPRPGCKSLPQTAPALPAHVHWRHAKTMIFLHSCELARAHLISNLTTLLMFPTSTPSIYSRNK